MEALLMLSFKTGLRFGKLLVGASLVAGLAGPASAGNAHYWVSDDGTHSFTDDPKRIPAKHRDQAQKRAMGELRRYERYTEVSAPAAKPYAERVRERQSELRELAGTAPQGAVVGAIASQAPAVGYTIPVTGGGNRGGRSAGSLWVPVGGTTSVDSEPTVIESRRMDPSDSLATRHWTFVKKGDEIVTVIKGERRQRPLRALSEDDYDFCRPREVQARAKPA